MEPIFQRCVVWRNEDRSGRTRTWVQNTVLSPASFMASDKMLHIFDPYFFISQRRIITLTSICFGSLIHRTIRTVHNIVLEIK